MMAGPVYKMFHARWTEAWYQLSEEQREGLFGKMNETAEKLGVKSVVICDSSWNSEKWLFWGVEEYPDMEAVQEYTKCLVELNWFRYCDSETLLGTRVQTEPA
jgi:hypothetical protein